MNPSCRKFFMQESVIIGIKNISVYLYKKTNLSESAECHEKDAINIEKTIAAMKKQYPKNISLLTRETITREKIDPKSIRSFARKLKSIY